MTYEVVCRTDRTTTAAWLALRNKGIGGSDAAAIQNVSKWKSAYTLWAEKSELVFPDEQSPGKAADYGKWLELPIAQKFAADNNVAVVHWPFMVRSLERPWQLANVDFLLVKASVDHPAGVVTSYYDEALPDGVLAIIEVKTTALVTYGNAGDWEHGAVPIAYDLQGLHYTDVLPVPSVVYLPFIGRQGIVMRERKYTDEQREMLRAAEQFFWDQVKSGEAPEIDGSDSSFETLKELYPKSFDKIAEADDFLVDTFEQWSAAKKAIALLEGQVAQLRASLQLAIGDAQAMMKGDKVLYTYSNNRAFNRDKFVSDHPELVAVFSQFSPTTLKELNPKLYEQYLEIGAGARVLRPKGEK